MAWSLALRGDRDPIRGRSRSGPGRRSISDRSAPSHRSPQAGAPALEDAGPCIPLTGEGLPNSRREAVAAGRLRVCEIVDIGQGHPCSEPPRQCSTIKSVNDLRHWRSILAFCDRYPSAMTSGITVPAARTTSRSASVPKPSIGQESTPLAAAASMSVCAAKVALRAAQDRLPKCPTGSKEAGPEESGKRGERRPDRP